MKYFGFLFTVIFIGCSLFLKAEINRDTIELSYLRINGKISFFSKKEKVYSILGKPDSLVYFSSGQNDTTFMYYFGNIVFESMRDTLCFRSMDLTIPSKNRINIGGYELVKGITLESIEQRYPDFGLGISDTANHVEVLWCPLTNHRYADAFQFIFKNKFLVEVRAWIDD